MEVTMKGIAEPEVEVSGNGRQVAKPQASTTERTIVIVLSQIVVLVALIVIWRVVASRRTQD